MKSVAYYILTVAMLLLSTYPILAGTVAAKTLLKENVEKIVFAERTFGPDPHWYANFGYRFDGPENKLYGSKGRLCILDVATTNIIALIDDPAGAVRDPQVHYDARKILFSYRKGGTPQYHLYEINVDGSGLKQLTDGIYDDIEPSYLPDGGIVFVSSRSKRWVNCWLVQVANIHRCDANGKNIRVISANIETDNTPWVLPDGRVIFTRWEYIDRSQVRFHHLWTCNPDGTNQKAYFGNMHPKGLFIDAKPIPDSDRVVYINSPYHGLIEHLGRIASVTDKNGPDHLESNIIISKNSFRDPYPITDKLFLTARKKTELGLMTEDGQYTLLYQSEVAIHEPRPLLKRKRERIIPSRINLKKTTGTLILNNAYIGRNMGGVEKGDIKKLLVLESLPKPLNYGGSYHDFIPMSHGGTFTLERILGTVPVEEDGSAHFEVPANRPIFFIALDEKNQSVKRMHSFMTVMPGEILSCVGCHEERVNTPQVRPAMLQAMKRPASKIETPAGNPFTIDFPRDIQPILNKHCVKCHSPEEAKGRIILTGDSGPIFSLGYFSLAGLGYISDGRNANGNSAPRSVGDSASELMDFLDGSHYKAKPSSSEVEMIRNWIHIGAPFPGTYAALGTGMIHAKPQDSHDIKGEMPLGELTEKNHAARKQADEAFERNCKQCHPGKLLPRLDQGSLRWKKGKAHKFWDTHMAFNLTHPEKSAILLAPLAKKAGGWGLCKDITAFSDTENDDYKVILAWIEAGKQILERNKRWTMPGFKPHPYYIREMIRYGVLPETFDLEKNNIDVFELDRNYFKMNWYYPDGKEPKLYENKNINQSLQIENR